MAFSDRILNKALELALEYGHNYRKPINSRLKDTFPDLSMIESSVLNCKSSDLRDSYDKMVYRWFDQYGREKSTKKATSLFYEHIKTNNIWMSTENKIKLFQHCFISAFQ